MSNVFKLGQLKICVEKTLNKHSRHIDDLKNKSTSHSHFTKLRAAFLNGFSWKPNDTITIGFMGDGTNVSRKTYNELSNEIDTEGKRLKIDPLQKIVDNMSVIDGIKEIIKQRIQPIVGLTFNYVDDPNSANVRISFDVNDGAWAVIGTQCLDDENNGKATMNLGWFDVATTIHEFGHVLGLIHEHQNSHDNPISWNKQAVYEWAQSDQHWDQQTTNENILQNYPVNQINGSIFDPLSIMLYFFPASLTTNQQGTRQNLRLSGYDVKYISEKYPGGSVSPEDFYFNAYNQTLQDNIKESTIALHSKYPITPNMIFYITISIISLVSIIILIILFR